MEGDYAVQVGGQPCKLVRRFVDKRAGFQRAFFIEEVGALHFSKAFSAAGTAVVSGLEVFSSAEGASAASQSVAYVGDSALYRLTAHSAPSRICRHRLSCRSPPTREHTRTEDLHPS